MTFAVTAVSGKLGREIAYALLDMPGGTLVIGLFLGEIVAGIYDGTRLGA